MINYNKNKLINKCINEYCNSFACMQDTADYIPENYIVKTLAYIYKNMRKQFKKIDREDKRYQKQKKRNGKSK